MKNKFNKVDRRTFIDKSEGAGVPVAANNYLYGRYVCVLPDVSSLIDDDDDDDVEEEEGGSGITQTEKSITPN